MDEMIIQENNEVEVCNESGNSGGGAGLAIGLGILATVGAGIAIWAHKTKDKREAKKIEKLRAKGYVIYEPAKPEDNNVCEDTND